jgi:hypothetical protein
MQDALPSGQRHASTAGPAAAATPKRRPMSDRERRALMLGWLVSGVLHVIALLIAGLIMVDAGAGGSDRGTVEIELASSLPEQQNEADRMAELAEAPLELDTAEMPEIIDDMSLTEALESSTLNPASTAGIEGLTGSGGAEGSDGLMTGSGGANASFFGVRARGTRFAYIVDASGSMVGERWNEARQALIQSVNDLPDYTSFSVSLFNDAPILPLRDRKPVWRSAKEENKSDFRTWVRGVSPAGSTKPEKAFTLIMNLRPRPDAIYFLTDGEFDETVPDMVAALNAQGRTIVIHTIAFVTEDGAHLLRRIAEESGGTYRFVPGTPP